MNSDLNVSVLIATYNRADVLRETLEAFTELDRDGLSVEFVVIDNNSGDHTKSVVESFSDRLPLVYLFQAVPGKNRALNKALNEVALGRLVVFTDDDVDPRPDWLQAIVQVSGRWPQYCVFGGRQIPLYPGDAPPWTEIEAVEEFCYGRHDYALQERLYDATAAPFGANFWVRRGLFEAGHRYDGAIGPGSAGGMGSETFFLGSLREAGFEFVYCPDAVVLHRIDPTHVKVRYVLRKAFRHGLGQARIHGVLRSEFLAKWPLIWVGSRVVAMAKWLLRYVAATFTPSVSTRMDKKVTALRWLGYNFGSVREAFRHGLYVSGPSRK